MAGNLEVTLPEQSVTLEAPDASTNSGTSTTPSSIANTETSNTTNSQTQTSSTLNTLSNGDLPWAKVLLPTTSAGQGGLGEGRHGLKPESWVYGIFLDGDSCQQPLVLGVISGGPGGAYSSSGSSSGTAGGSGDGSNISVSGAVGGDNAEKCYNLLVRHGYSPQNAAGILGNLLNEGVPGKNKDLNPTQNEIGGGGGYGIAQWTDKGRKNGLKRVAGSQYNTIEGQTKYLIHELKTSEHVAERLLQNSRNDVAASTKAFMNFERPAGHSQALARRNGGDGIPPNLPKLKERVASAQAFYKKMMSKGATQTNTPSNTTPATNKPVPTS